MLTSIEINHFKRLKSTGRIAIEENVVLLGANNSGKTTFLQAISLWQLGLVKWIDKRSGKNAFKRTGVAINRKDILTVPVRHSKMLWNNLFTLQTERTEEGKIKGSKHVNIEITVTGISGGEEWECGLEFEYRDEEVIYVRPLNPDKNVIIHRPDLLKSLRVFYLPTMSGLKSTEEKLLPETIAARIGEGRTAEVLRNICYLVCNPETASQVAKRNPKEDWDFIRKKFKDFFLVDLEELELDSRGELQLFYREEGSENRLEIISAGRGFQQILLLTACVLLNPHSVLLIDEPDAHLEILKQREIYNLLKEIAQSRHSQLIVATHSEVLMNESSGEDKIVIFYPVGAPKPLTDRNARQILKSLKDYGFENYVLAERNRFVLYLEGSTDRDILVSFSRILKHKAEDILKETFIYCINQGDPAIARRHFNALKDAVPDLKGVAVFDRITNPLNLMDDSLEYSWQRREIENYFFRPEFLLRWVDSSFPHIDLFSSNDRAKQIEAMKNAIENIVPRYALNDENAEYWTDQKASEEMDKIFRFFFRELGKPVEFSKNKYFEIVNLLRPEEVHPDIVYVLDKIVNYASDRSSGDSAQ